jgi:hypothetical protein
MQQANLPQSIAHHSSFFNDPYSIAVALAVLIIFALSIRVMLSSKDDEGLEYRTQLD